MTACAFTGHRPQRFHFQSETRPICMGIKEQLIIQAKNLTDTQGVHTFYVGGALGADMWASEAIQSLQQIKRYAHIQLRIVLPYKDHIFYWNNDDKQRLDTIRQKADAVIILSDSYHQHAYRDRNYFMVDHAEFLIAIYDNGRNFKSGTGQTYRYAQRKGRKICLIHPDTAQVTFSPSFKG